MFSDLLSALNEKMQAVDYVYYMDPAMRVKENLTLHDISGDLTAAEHPL